MRTLGPRCTRNVVLESEQEYLNIGNVAISIGREVCEALVGMHAYTECDIVRAFVGKCKAIAKKLLSSNKVSQDTFRKLG